MTDIRIEVDRDRKALVSEKNGKVTLVIYGLEPAELITAIKWADSEGVQSAKVTKRGVTVKVMR